MTLSPRSPGSESFGISRNALLSGLSSYSVAKVLPGLITLATVPLWVRVFGASAYGTYTVVWVATVVTSSFLVGWLRQAILRYSGRESYGLFGIAPGVIIAIVVVSAIPGAIAVAVAGVESARSGSLAWLVAACVLFGASNALYLLLQAQAQRDQRMIAYSSAEIVRAALALLISFPLAGLGMITGGAALVVSYTVATVCGVGVLLRRRRREELRTPGATLDLWRYGWPMSLWLGLSLLLAYSDRLILGMSDGTSVVGAYAASSDLIVRGLSMVTFPIAMVAHPIIMRAWNAGDRANALRISRNFTRLMIGVSAFAAFALIAFGTPLLEWVLDVDVSSPWTVPLLSVGAAAWQVAQLAHKPLELADQTLTMAILMATVFTFSFAANLVLIPRLGSVAAAAVFAGGALAYLAMVFSLGAMKSKRWLVK